MTERPDRQYLVSFIATLKQTVNERRRLQERLDLWRRRVKLAAEKGEPELAAQAEERVSQTAEQLKVILGEETELRREIQRAKEETAREEHESQSGVDTELLLAELEMAAGKPDETARAFAELEAQQELEKLKRKLHNRDEAQRPPNGGAE